MDRADRERVRLGELRELERVLDEARRACFA